MQGSLDYPPIVIRSSAFRSILIMIGCATVAAFGYLLIAMDPSGSSRAWGALVGFGLGVPYFAWKALIPDTLTLSREGMEWRSRWKTTRWSWRDVSRFRAVRIHIASEAVAFDLADGVTAPKTYTNYYVSYAGADASLGIGWELGATALADLLNTARARWVGEAPATARDASFANDSQLA